MQQKTLFCFIIQACLREANQQMSLLKARLYGRGAKDSCPGCYVKCDFSFAVVVLVWKGTLGLLQFGHGVASD